MDSSMPYLLTTARLGMRRWRDSDLDIFAEMNADPEVREFFPGLLTREESAESIARMEACFDRHGYMFYATDELATGMLIGFVGLGRPNFEAFFTPCVEIGWRLRREAWGFGYATEGGTACLRHGFEQLGLERIYAFTAVGNVRSERVMQKIGMKKAGEFEHPKLAEGHWLRRHVVYDATRGV
ncbi:MAG TPA: GNAT family N-acetyltransferase [Puia sp.]|nr:GNAT family N-acetyltransferase [Puia sp.]